MMRSRSGMLSAAGALVVLAAACQSSGAGGRRIDFTQTDSECTPQTVAVKPGEKLNLTVKNDSGKDAYEVEGIEGTKVEEFMVPGGKTRSVGYTVPDGDGTHKLKCYVVGGPTTIIDLVASSGGGAAPPAESGATVATGGAGNSAGSASTPSAPDTTVAVTLVDYMVAADKTSVKAGAIRFIATNASAGSVHELAVLKVKPDGSFDTVGEIEAIDPQQGGTVTVDLKEPGAYQLACLIAAGESGSAVDHYQQGMHIAFTVE